MSEVSFASLKARYNWKPIRNCPGRFILAGGVSSISPEELCGMPAQVFEHSTLCDPVVMIPFTVGGLISYQKGADTYIHTLCDAAGFERKLKSLGVLDKNEASWR